MSDEEENLQIKSIYDPTRGLQEIMADLKGVEKRWEVLYLHLLRGHLGPLGLGQKSYQYYKAS